MKLKNILLSTLLVSVSITSIAHAELLNTEPHNDLNPKKTYASSTPKIEDWMLDSIPPCLENPFSYLEDLLAQGIIPARHAFDPKNPYRKMTNPVYSIENDDYLSERQEIMSSFQAPYSILSSFSPEPAEETLILPPLKEEAKELHFVEPYEQIESYTQAKAGQQIQDFSLSKYLEEVETSIANGPAARERSQAILNKEEDTAAPKLTASKTTFFSTLKTGIVKTFKTIARRITKTFGGLFG